MAGGRVGAGIQGGCNSTCLANVPLVYLFPPKTCCTASPPFFPKRYLPPTDPGASLPGPFCNLRQEPHRPCPDSPEKKQLSLLHNRGWRKTKRDHFCHTRAGTVGITWIIGSVRGKEGVVWVTLCSRFRNLDPIPLLPTRFNSKNSGSVARG